MPASPQCTNHLKQENVETRGLVNGHRRLLRAANGEDWKPQEDLPHKNRNLLETCMNSLITTFFSVNRITQGLGPEIETRKREWQP